MLVIINNYDQNVVNNMKNNIMKIYREIKYSIRRFFWRIKNICKWIPLLWKQFDFDYGYAVDAFKFQLIKLAEFMESDKAYTVDAKERAKRIRTAIRLMEKVYNEDYGCEYQDQIRELYGNREFVFTPIPDKPDFSSLEFVFDEKYDQEQLKSIGEIEHELFLKSQAKQKKAHRILWKYIEHNIQGWWS